MSNVFIKKLKITGTSKKVAEIQFAKGLNIIYGPSNTGKTYIIKCIDYLFGAKNNPISVLHGYEFIEIEVSVNQGNIFLKRELDSNKIHVDSNVDWIDSGIYSIKNSKNPSKAISSVWLKIMGINEIISIVASETYRKQTLTIRTFLHMFLLNEERIIAEKSIVYSGNNQSKTAELSSLIYMLDGKKFDGISEYDKKLIKEVKKAAVVSYIKKEISELAERNIKLEDINDEVENFEEIVQQTIEKIAEVEEQITEAIKNNQSLLRKINILNEKYSESSMLLQRYQKLESQYNSDLKRLNFIVDSENNIGNEITSNCPVCDGKMHIKNGQPYTEAAKGEYKKICIQLEELNKTIKYVQEESDIYEKELLQCNNERKYVNELIETELNPRVNGLKVELSKYKVIIRNQKEIEILRDIVQKKEKDIYDVQMEEESELKYKPKENFSDIFFNDISEKLLNALNNCKYENLISARLDKGSFDLSINGKNKNEFGKGYRAFENTIFSFMLLKHLDEQAFYKFGMAFFDSPILSLKEKEKRELGDGMKNGLFKLFVEECNDVQLIIVENEIPVVDYKDANLIYFSKDKKEGRYGLLYDVE